MLFESDTKAPLENHIDREEIRNAIKNTPEAVERYSDTFGCEMTYYALKTELDDGTKVILRMALKSSHINGYFIITLPILFMVLCISLGFSIVFSDVISKKVTSKITDVGKSLRSLNDGNYAPIKTSSDEPELYTVLNEINELNSSIHKHIRKETEERNKHRSRKRLPGNTRNRQKQKDNLRQQERYEIVRLRRRAVGKRRRFPD